VVDPRFKKTKKGLHGEKITIINVSQLEIRVGHGDHVLRPILIRTFVTALVKYHVHYYFDHIYPLYILRK
jgi:hypothetical protein